MATTAAPNGARPIGLLGGQPYAGAIRHISIASAYSTAIFYGDFVKLVAAGTIEKDAGTDAMTPVGVFMGCSYSETSLGYKLFNQQWVASTVASDAVAYVCDDPDILMQMQSDQTLAQAALGSNVGIIQTAGDTNIGTSKNAVDGSSSLTTSTLPLRIVDFVDGPTSTVGDAFTDVIVKYNVGHQYTNTTGI
jgi:hypothetical protein